MISKRIIINILTALMIVFGVILFLSSLFFILSALVLIIAYMGRLTNTNEYTELTGFYALVSFSAFYILYKVKQLLDKCESS